MLPPINHYLAEMFPTMKYSVSVHSSNKSSRFLPNLNKFWFFCAVRCIDIKNIEIFWANQQTKIFRWKFDTNLVKKKTSKRCIFSDLVSDSFYSLWNPRLFWFKFFWIFFCLRIAHMLATHGIQKKNKPILYVFELISWQRRATVL